MISPGATVSEIKSDGQRRPEPLGQVLDEDAGRRGSGGFHVSVAKTT